MVVAHPAYIAMKFGISTVLSHDDAVSSRTKLRIGQDVVHHGGSGSPDIIGELILSQLFRFITDSCQLGRSKGGLSQVTEIFPLPAVIVLPYDQGDRSARKISVRNAIIPHPLVPKGVSVKDSVKAKFFSNQDDVPSWIPSVVQPSCNVIDKRIVGIVSCSCLKIRHKVSPDF